MSTRQLLVKPRLWILLAIGGVLVGLVALPATGAPQRTAVGNKLLAHMSQSVAIHYWLANPDLAPNTALSGLRELRNSRAAARPASTAAAPTDDLFNLDKLGLPQNEESISV